LSLKNTTGKYYKGDSIMISFLIQIE